MKKFWKKLAFLLVFVAVAWANTQGPNAPTTATNSGVGVLWSNPANALANDATYATAALNLTSTRDLVVTGFGFTIPAGATINGILVEIERKSTQTGSITDLSVRVIKAGVATGTDKAATLTQWPVAEAFASYGGAADLWGAAWTASDINATNFGASVSAVEGNGVLDSPAVDFIRITITFTPAICKSCMFLPMSQTQTRTVRSGI